MGLDLEVHKVARDAEGSSYIAASKPYIRLMSSESNYPLYVQNGEVYAESGVALLKPPAWFFIELSKCTPSMLKAVGMGLPGSAVSTAAINSPALVEQPRTVGGVANTREVFNVKEPLKVKEVLNVKAAASGIITT